MSKFQWKEGDLEITPPPKTGDRIRVKRDVVERRRLDDDRGVILSVHGGNFRIALDHSGRILDFAADEFGRVS